MTESKENSMAADLRLLAAPFRALIRLFWITALIFSFPLICLVLLLMVGYGAQLHAWLLNVYAARGWGFPFAALLVNFVDAPSPDEVSLLKVLLAVFGPFASSIWFALTVCLYQRGDFERKYGCIQPRQYIVTSCYGFIGFLVSAFAGGYVFFTQDDSVPAVYFCKAVVACFSPSLLYLVYRIFKTKGSRSPMPPDLQGVDALRPQEEEREREKKQQVRTERRLDQHREKERQHGQTSGSTGANSSREAGLGLKAVEEDCRLLGVEEYYTLDELNVARRTKAAQWHPDKLDNMAPELKEFASQQLARFNGAYERLSSAARSDCVSRPTISSGVPQRQRP